MSLLLQHPDVGEQFWQSYEDCLLRRGTKSGQVHWHKDWCRQFLTYIAPRPLLDCKPENLTAFLNSLPKTPCHQGLADQAARWENSG